MSQRVDIATYMARPRRARILNFGPPKNGKTYSLISLMKWLVRTYGPDARMWVFDFDRGILPLVTWASKQRPMPDITIFEYAPTGGDKMGNQAFRPRGQGQNIFLDWMKDFNQLYDMIGPDGNWKVMPVDPQPPHAVVFDTMTGFQEVALDFVLNAAGHELNAPNTDARADYGKQMGKVQELADCCATLPCITIWNAHETLDKNEVTGEIRNDPAFTGKLAPVIGAKFDGVLYSTTNAKGEYVWQTKPKGFVKAAGQRFTDQLPNEIAQDYAIVFGDAK